MSILKWRNDRRDADEALSYEEALRAQQQTASALLASARTEGEREQARRFMATTPERALTMQDRDRYSRGVRQSSDRSWGKSAAEIEDETNAAIRDGTYDRDAWYR